MDNQLTRLAADKAQGFDLGAWRQAMGLTQQQAADYLGVTRRQLGRWERGEAAMDARTIYACLFLSGLKKPLDVCPKIP